MLSDRFFLQQPERVQIIPVVLKGSVRPCCDKECGTGVKLVKYFEHYRKYLCIPYRINIYPDANFSSCHVR